MHPPLINRKGKEVEIVVSGIIFVNSYAIASYGIECF